MISKTKLMTAMLLFSSSMAMSQMKVRDELPDKYKWNLTDLYATDEAWKQEKDRLQTEMQKVAQYKGKLTQSPATLLEALEFNAKLGKERSEEHTSELQSRENLVCRLLLEKKKI